MYPFLLFIHSLFRWAVLLSLCYAIYRGIRGWSRLKPFNKTDDVVRHTTATIAHIQLCIGYVLYFQSPIISYFREQYAEASKQFNILFFGMIHIALMTLAVIIITIGSSMAKRQTTDIKKIRVMTCFFVAALIIIFIAIPWPFSPFSQRPWLRAL